MTLRDTVTCLVVVIGMLKGGSGKTTTAVFVALHYALEGKRVLLLDGDKTSQSSYDWATLAAEQGTELPFRVERHVYEDVADHIAARRADYDVIVVDAGGGDRPYLENAVSAADRLLITLAPSGADARRVNGTFEAASRGAERNSNPDGVEVAVVLVRADFRTGQPAAWRRQLIEDGHTLTEVAIRDVVKYSDAYGNLPADAGEYVVLLAELDGQLADLAARFDQLPADARDLLETLTARAEGTGRPAELVGCSSRLPEAARQRVRKLVDQAEVSTP